MKKLFGKEIERVETIGPYVDILYKDGTTDEIHLNITNTKEKYVE